MKYWEVTSWVSVGKVMSIEKLTVVADDFSKAADSATQAYSRILTNEGLENKEHRERVKTFIDGIRKVELLLDDSTLGKIRSEFTWWGIRRKITDGTGKESQ